MQLSQDDALAVTLVRKDASKTQSRVENAVHDDGRHSFVDSRGLGRAQPGYHEDTMGKVAGPIP